MNPRRGWAPPGPSPRLFGIPGTLFESADTEPSDPASYLWTKPRIEVEVLETVRESASAQARARATGTTTWAWQVVLRRDNDETSELRSNENYGSPREAAEHVARFVAALTEDVTDLMRGRP